MFILGLRVAWFRPAARQLMSPQRPAVTRSCRRFQGRTGPLNLRPDEPDSSRYQKVTCVKTRRRPCSDEEASSPRERRERGPPSSSSSSSSSRGFLTDLKLRRVAPANDGAVSCRRLTACQAPALPHKGPHSERRRPAQEAFVTPHPASARSRPRLIIPPE